MIDVAIFGAFLTITAMTKDKVVRSVALLYTLLHLYNLFYSAGDWYLSALYFEAAVCLLVGGFILSQSVRTWAVYLVLLLIMSIGLILIEFVDYLCCNSYLNETYKIWIYITTGLELLILTLARNGLLHSYTDSFHDFWLNIHRVLRHNVSKVFVRQD